MKQLNRVLLLIFFLSITVYPQDGMPGAVTSDSLFKIGENYVRLNKFDSALVYLQKSALIYENLGLWENYILCNNSIASALRQKGNIDSSITLLEKLLELQVNTIEKENPVFIKTRNQLGQSYRAKGNHEKALQLALENLDYLTLKEDNIEKAENYFLLGMTYSDRGEFNASIRNLELALKHLEKNNGELPPETLNSRIANIYNGIAGCFQQAGNYDLAIEYYKKTLGFKIKAFGDSHSDVGVIYNNLAAAYFYMEDNSTALEYYHKALSIDRLTKAPDDLSLGYRYNNIAMAYRVNKEYEAALKYSEYARDIFKKKLGEKHPGYAGVINNTGRIYFDMQQYHKAIELYKAAFAVWKEKYGDEHYLVAQSYFNIGEALGAEGNYDSSLSMLNKSLAIRLSVLGNKHPKVAESFEGMAKVYYAQQNFDSVSYLCRKAVLSLSNEFYDSTLYSNPDPDKIIWPNEVLSPLIRKGEAFTSRYNKSREPDDLVSGLSNFLFASRLVSKVRHGFKSEGSKLSFSNNAFLIYEKGINAALALFTLTKDEEYKKTAFKLSEESKAALLFEAVSESKARSFAGIPDSLLEREKNTRIELVVLETQLANERQKKLPSEKFVNQIEDKYFSLHNEYTIFLESLEKNYNAYYNLKYKERNVSVEKIMEKLVRLPEEGMIIEYFLSDTAINIFTLSRNKLDVVTVKPEVSVPGLVIELRESLQNLEFNNYNSSAFSLYKALIKPVEEQISNTEYLYLVPDGILNYLPFEALLSDEVKLNGEVDFSKLPYLINRYNINYLYTADLSEEKSETNKSKYNFAGFAPVFSEESPRSENNNSPDAVAARIPAAIALKRAVEINDKTFPGLPETKREVEGITSLFQNESLNGTSFIYSNAREETIKSDKIKDYNFVHIASHGFINEEKPNYSGLLFTDKNNPETEDGILYSSEIYNLNLKADLVVLSACESGLGKIVRGEGILGLTRGFFYAGAKKMVVSLWQVADKSTSELMIQFYKNILAGNTFSSALRQAKLKMIKEGIYSYPLEWAPFVLIGE